MPEAGTTLRAARHTYSHTLYVNQKHTLVSLSLSHAHTHTKEKHTADRKTLRNLLSGLFSNLIPSATHTISSRAHTHTRTIKRYFGLLPFHFAFIIDFTVKLYRQTFQRDMIYFLLHVRTFFLFLQSLVCPSLCALSL